MLDVAAIPVFAVHGFMFDPKDKGGSNDPKPFFEVMSAVCGRDVTPFPWYSAPFGLRATRPFHSVYQTARAWLSAWAHGKPQPYAYAWELATRAAADLVVAIQNTPGQVDLVAHSLGVRVAIQALWALPANKVRRVVFFNGAELESNARKAYRDILRGLSALTTAQILNIAVRGDDVLRYLGANFSGDPDGPCVGRVGLRGGGPANWRDLFLDSEQVRVRAHGRRPPWILRGDAPGDLLDHSVSYNFPGNVDLVRAWFAGDDLVDLVGVR